MATTASRITPTPRQRKTPMIQSKSTLTSHSPFSLMKKAAAGIQDQATPYHKAIFQDKRVVETLDKYILAQAEGVEAWTGYMDAEMNPAIKTLYQNVCDLNQLLVKVQLEYRKEVPEQRKLFKRLMQGEQELHKLLKQATAAATKAGKVGKQLDEALLRNRASKGGLDMKKLEHLQLELEKSTQEDATAQNKYALGIENYQKYKYNEVRKMMTKFAEAEISMFQDCWKIAEARLKICKLLMTESACKASGINVHRASEDSREVLRILTRDLGIEGAEEVQGAQPVHPVHVILPQHVLHDPTRVIPSAPMSDTISQRSSGSTRSTTSSGLGSDMAETDAVYNPIPDEMDALYNPIPDDDSDNEDYKPQYIYEFDEDEFEEEIYENVEDSTENKVLPNYLDLQDDTTPTTAPPRPNRSNVTQNAPQVPPRVIRQPIRDSDLYEPDRDPPAAIRIQTINDDIFGSIGSLQLGMRPPSPGEEYSYADPQRHTDSDEEGGMYGHMWEAQSGLETNSSLSSTETSLPNRTGSSGSNSSLSRRGGVRDSTVSMVAVEETRYVKYPGSIGDRPATVGNKQTSGNIEEALKKSLEEYHRRKGSNQQAPPPLPARRRPDGT